MIGSSVRPSIGPFWRCRTLGCLWRSLVDALLEDRSLHRLSAHQLRDIGVSEIHPHRHHRDLL